MNVTETAPVPQPESRSGYRVTSARVHVDDRLPAYTTREFLDDQSWLLRRLDASGPFEDRVERHGERYLALHRESTRLEVREATARCREHLVSGSRMRRLATFFAICRFLDEHRADIVRNGLSIRDDPLTVREELVCFLITRYSRPGKEISECALTRFLDEWGHRWM